MKLTHKLVLGCLLILPFSARASTIIIALTNWDQNAPLLTNSVKITQVGPIRSDGTYGYIGIPRFDTGTTNGFYTNHLNQGNYEAQIVWSASDLAVEGFIPPKPILFDVPNDSMTYTIWSRQISGGNVFVTRIVNTNGGGTFTGDTTQFSGNSIKSGALVTNLQLEGNTSLPFPSTLSVGPAITLNGNDGSITASGFVGDASQATGLDAGNIATGVVPLANGGLGVSVANLVANGAHYDDGTAQGFAVYTVTAPAGVYLIVNPNALTGPDQGAINTDFSTSAINGLFTNNSTSFFLWCSIPSVSVAPSLYNSSPNAISVATLAGNLLGTIDPSVAVSDANLSANVQFQSKALNEFAGNGSQEHTLTSSNTAGGSTLSLKRIGNNGYADINFICNGVLQFAIGSAAEKDGTFGFYTDNYIELVSGRSFWFGNAGTWYGGVRGNVFNFVWFQNGQTNTPMFEIDRASNSITNYSRAVFQHGLASAATNDLSSQFTTTGITNTGTVNIICEGVTGTSGFRSNTVSGLHWSIGTITVPTLFILQPNDCLVFASGGAKAGVKQF